MTPKKQYYENAAQTVIKQLEKRYMEGYYYENSADAVAAILAMMPAESIVAWGGSATLDETGMMKALKSAPNLSILDRMTAKTPAEKREMFGRIVCSDYYFMSTNALTIHGELINIDGNGNRVACLCNGPQNVMILAGMNKLVTTVEEGVHRTRNMAAPPNANRLQYKTPCGITGVCNDCQTPECMCNQIVITRSSSRSPGRIKVFLIGEELGF